MFCCCGSSAVAPDAPSLRGISSLCFESTFLQEVLQAGHRREDPVYAVEEDVIRRRGAHLRCPADGRQSTSYVDALATKPLVDQSEFMLSYSWGYAVGAISDALRDALGSQEHRYVWICCLCINQHRVKEAQVRANKPGWISGCLGVM